MIKMINANGNKSKGQNKTRARQILYLGFNQTLSNKRKTLYK